LLGRKVRLLTEAEYKAKIEADPQNRNRAHTGSKHAAAQSADGGVMDFIKRYSGKIGEIVQVVFAGSKTNYTVEFDGDLFDVTAPLLKMEPRNVDGKMPVAQMSDRGELVCPHCGAEGLDNFFYVENIMTTRELISLEEGTMLKIESAYKPCDEDSWSERLGCRKCDKDSRIPMAIEYDFE
jgi:hypothetical protein